MDVLCVLTLLVTHVCQDEDMHLGQAKSERQSVVTCVIATSASRFAESQWACKMQGLMIA